MNNKFFENDWTTCINQKKINKLIYIGTNYGFLNDNYRFEIYLILFNIDLDKIIGDDDFDKLDSDIEKIKQSSVIKKDILRTFHNRNFIGVSNLNKKDLMETLTIIISKFFNKYKDFTYYQGFNSLGEIIYLKYGKPFSFMWLENFCKIYFYQYLTNSYVDRMLEKINQIKLVLKNYFPFYYDIIKEEFFH